MLAVLIFILSMNQAQEVKKEIVIKKATVYLRGAKVFGDTNLNLQKGRNTVRIVNLPTNLNENTIGISLEKNVTLLSVTPSNNYMTEGQMTDVEKSLDSERKKLQREVSLLDIQLKSLNGESNLINNNLKILENDKVSPQEQLIKLSQFYAKRMLELDNGIFLLDEKKTELQEKINKINKQFSENQTLKNKNNKELILELLADAPISMDLGISYMVQNAGWVPSYDLRAKDTKSPLDIIYKGKIYQQTGQDWDNIRLSISTYMPSYNQNRPILNPLYVNEYLANNFDEKQKGYVQMEKAEFANSYQMRDEAVSQIPIATVSDSQMNILYELNYLQTIKSQEKEQYVILDKKSINADYQYHVVPKVNEQVFLLAKIKNWQNLNLISGEANIYFDDNYIGKTNVNTNYVNDEFPVFLGVDERIIVKRIKLEDKNAEGSFNSNKKETESYSISIKNNTKQTINIEILDQIPLSENNKISVKFLEIGNGNLDEKTGSILWKRDLASGASDKISFSYEVKYPKESNVHYYNR